MLPLLFALILFVFLLAGAIAFVICILLPPIRRYSLSAALWFASWGPCSIALMALAGLALVGVAFISKDGNAQSLHSPRLVSAFGWTYLIAGASISAAIATSVALLHQFIMHRLTFAFFRLYATVAVAGIGSVFGWCLSWWMVSRDVPYAWIWSLVGMLILVASFGGTAYRGARWLRGGAPKRLTWLSQKEFIGS